MSDTPPVETSKLERGILKHALGLQYPITRNPHRNYYCAGVGSKDGDLCSGLAQKGLMTEGPTIELRSKPGYQERYYYATEAGLAEVWDGRITDKLRVQLEFLERPEPARGATNDERR